MSAFLQTDAGGWSYDIPDREDDESPDLERDRSVGSRPHAPTDRKADR